MNAIYSKNYNSCSVFLKEFCDLAKVAIIHKNFSQIWLLYKYENIKLSGIFFF
jgi:hypothetical protein